MPSEILTIDPSTGKTLERFEYMPAAEIDAHFDAAAAAYRAWRHQPTEQRAQLLNAVGRVLRAQRQTLAETATREMGKPIAQELACMRGKKLAAPSAFVNFGERLRDRLAHLASGRFR